ncbi:MAG: glycosyltransferase family 39 protein [Acidobacteria bacterium]|nr:glycosyltransferase family 39 protein [Acidobacteriota bacterium]
MQSNASRNSILVIAAAAAMLAFMAILMFASAWNDSIIIDEAAHIGAAYGYLVKGDYRFNAEHPPLMKDLGVFPLLFMHLNAPWEGETWTTDLYGQGKFGRQLIFESGNDANAITRAVKIPMVLFTIAFGAILFWWSRRHYGDGAGLLTLFLYTFSPTFLAHGRFVTTDVGATAGFFIGTVTFLRFLRSTTGRNVVIAGLALGFALLTKFSTVELVAVVLFLACVWPWVHGEPQERFRSLARNLTLTAAIFLIAWITIYPLYLHHTWNYPPQRQHADTEFILTASKTPAIAKDLVVWMSDKHLLRPWAQYLTGFFEIVHRQEGGNTPFFLGTVYESGQRLYFPFVYLVKEPLALHLLTILTLAFAFWRIRRPPWSRKWLENHFTEFAFLVVILFYWGVSIRSSLNIGVRHILPTFPFVYILVASGIVRLDGWLRNKFSQLPPVQHADAVRHRGHLTKKERRAREKSSVTPPTGPLKILFGFRLVIGILILWQAVSVLRVHPSYLAYFNEIAGGPDGGYRYVTDSNLDWGQDLQRLAAYSVDHNIPGFYLDYFGTAMPEYYMKGRVAQLERCKQPPKGWVAISAMWYQQSRQIPQCDYRRWVPMENLVKKIGYSIFVFHID